MNQSAKAKEKHSSSQLVWTTEYELVSPYTVEHCIAQLNPLTTKYKNKHSPFWNIVDFEFDSFHDNGGVVQYSILANTEKLGINGKAFVQLLYQSENNTVVRVRIGLTKWQLILYCIWIAFLNVVFIFGYSPSYAILFADVFFLGLQIANCTALKPELYKTLCEALAISEAPRPKTLPP